MRRIVPTILAGLIGLSSISDVNAEDYIQHLSEAYNIPIEQLQLLRGDLFNDLNLRGIVGNFTYDLTQPEFRQYMIKRFGEKGKATVDFLNQGGTEEYGISRDSATGNVFLNKVLVTPDNVITRSLPLDSEQGPFLNNFALAINSPLSAIHRFREDGKTIHLEVVGGEESDYVIQTMPNNVLRKAVPGLTFMTEEEREEFYVMSGMKNAMQSTFTVENGHGSVSRLFEDTFGSKMEIDYGVEGDQQFNSVGLTHGANILEPSRRTSYDLPYIPSERLGFSNEQLKEIGLEGQVLLAWGNPVEDQGKNGNPKGESGMTPQGKGSQETGSDEFVPPTADSTDWAWRVLVGGGLPAQATGGLGLRRNDYFVDAFAGYGPSGVNNEPRVVPGTDAPNGSRIDFLRTTEENIKDYIAGLSMGKIFPNGWHIALEPFYTVRRTEETGSAIPQKYRDGEFRENDPSQPIYEKRTEKYPGFRGRIGKGRLSVHPGITKNGGSITVTITGGN